MKVKSYFLIFIFFLISAGSFAKDVYVTDQCKIIMRKGESGSDKILRQLSSGDKLKLIRQNKVSGYSRIKTEKGEIGYVLNHQILANPIAKIKLMTVNKQLLALTSEPDKIAGKLVKLQLKYNELTQKSQDIVDQFGVLQKDYQELRAISDSAVQTEEKYLQLNREQNNLIRQNEELKQSNLEYRNHAKQHWFMIGAGVILLGIIIGLILPNLTRRRQKSSWGNSF